jgi:Xaa-Pro aminopeptidase
MSVSALSALRQELVRQGLDGFIVPRADEHLGEYVPGAAERLAWLTGFTGSAGLAVVLASAAAVFTDGRYVLQLAEQTDPALWQRLHLTEQPPPAWLAAHAPNGRRIGYDPLLISQEGLGRYTDAGLTMVAVERNPIDAVWPDRPAAPTAPAVPHPLAYAGRTSEEKRGDVANLLREAKQDAAVLTDPASIAWLLNIRGGDVPFTPFALGFALVHADGATDVFMHPAKLPPATRAWLGNAVSVADRTALAPALAKLAGKTVRVDAAGSPVWFAQQLEKAGAVVASASDPCLLPKARKNPAEQQGARQAHLRDAAAVCRFLHWLSVEAPSGRQTEISAAAALLEFRREAEGFRGESFPAISGAGEHGAIIHYRVTPESNRAIRPNEVYLIDSGAQYADGTTDITRTVWTGPDGRAAGSGDQGDAGTHRHRHRGVSERSWRRPSGCLRQTRVVAGRVGLRPRHGSRGRELPVGARGPGQPVPAGPPGSDRCGDDPVQRTRILPAGAVRHPPGKPVAGAAGGFAGSGQTVSGVRDLDPGPVRSAAFASGVDDGAGAWLGKRLPRQGSANGWTGAGRGGTHLADGGLCTVEFWLTGAPVAGAYFHRTPAVIMGPLSRICNSGRNAGRLAREEGQLALGAG